MQRSNGGTAGNPRVLFGHQLRNLRTQAGMSADPLGAPVFVTGDMVSKIERGDRGPSDSLVEALEALPELASRNTLALLWDDLKEHLTGRPLPSWFEDWARAESQAVKLRWFEPIL